MRPSKALLSMFLAGFITAQLSARERTTAELRSGEGVLCNELTVPKRWTVPPYERNRAVVIELDRLGFYLGYSMFELRQSARLLLGAATEATIMPERNKSLLYSPDIYAMVQRKGKAVLEHASADEWNAALVLRPSGKSVAYGIPGLTNLGLDGKPIQYAGHAFMPSGPRLQGGIASTDQAYLALMTWDGIDYPGDILTPHRTNGRFFIDIFRVSNGRKAALIQGTFHDIGPGEFVGQSFWIDGSRFVLPLSHDMRRLFVCEVLP
jgi:hypothetical protein